MIGIRLEGWREAQSALKAMGVEASDMRRAFGNIATRAAHVAAALAPHRTGRLARSVIGLQGRNRARVKAGSPKRVPYAGPINYGWPARNIQGSFFLQRAAVQVVPYALGALQSDLNRIIREKGLA